MLQRSVVMVTVAVFVASAALGVVADRWYATVVRREMVGDMRTQLLPYANSAAGAIGRHVSRMAALAAFVQSLQSRADLEREFPPFVDGLMSSIPGLRSIQIVRDGRVAVARPLDRNRAAIGLSLRDSPDSATRAGYRRVMATDSVTLFGPAKLVQGGTAFVLDQRVRVPYDPHIDQVAMLVDIDAVLAQVQLDSLSPGFAIELRDAKGRVVDSLGGALPADPVAVRVEVRGGDWTLRGGPAGGWAPVVSEKVLPVRIATVVIVALLTLLAAQVSGRDARLTEAVAARTATLVHVTAEQQETIARQLETERALAASEERLRLALAAGRTATYEMDLLTDRVVWSPGVGAMFGLGRDAVPSGLADSVRLIDERDRALVQRTVGAARKEASHGTIELRAIGADAVSRWLMLTWLSRADDDGVIRRLVGTLTDISERKALEEQFLHAQKMQAMGSLAGGIAHDFNNLLTVILGAAQIARASLEGTDAPETLRTDIEEVLAAGDRAAMLTGQLLAFSRRQVVQPRHFDGCDLVGGMGTMLRRLVGEQIRVETALPGSTVPLFADHGQLTQVLMNLAVNARDAMPEGGTLRINLRIDGAPSGSPLPDETLRGERFAVLSVSDSGTGIDPSVLPLIFDPFFTTKPVGQGTGLGLSTVYGIVTQLGGTVRVASTVGRGTTFDVYLPLAVGSVESVEAVVAAPASFEEQPRTILLAEDEQGLRRVAARVLRAAGFSVILAENGEEALTAAAAHAGAIDLLVSDVVMPRLGGLDLASLLLRERPATRVLFMSGYPQDAGHGTPVSLANAAFLAKPFKPSDLVAAVRRALAEA